MLPRILFRTFLIGVFTCTALAKKKEDRMVQDPKFDVNKGFCVLGHVGKGPENLTQSCDDFLHERFPTVGWRVVRPCGKDPDTNVSRTAYIALERWHTPEHCRAGCESCFVAMEERRAKSAVCRREVGWSACGMGVTIGDPRQAESIHCGDGGTACTLDWTGNVWEEFGFEGTKDGLASKELEVEYSIRVGDSPVAKVEQLLNWRTERGAWWPEDAM